VIGELKSIAISDTAANRDKLRAFELLGKTIALSKDRAIVTPGLPVLGEDEVARLCWLAAEMERTEVESAAGGRARVGPVPSEAGYEAGRQ